MTCFVFNLALSLRGRLIALICLATLPAILFTFYLADQERRASLSRATSQASYMVNLVSKEHFYQMSGARGLLTWLTQQLPADATTIDSKFLAALLSGYPQLANIAVLTPEADVLMSAQPLPGAINMASFSAIQRSTTSGEIETGEYVIGPIVKKPLLHLSKAVRKADGRLSQIVFVAIDLKWLNRLAEQVELPPEHILLIVDRDGTVLACSGHDAASVYPVGKRVFELSEHARNGKAKSSNTAFITAPMAGVTGVMVAMALPYKHINGEANAIFYRTLGLLFVLTLCTVVSVLVLEEVSLLKYLRALAGSARRFGNGDYSVRAPVPHGYGELEHMTEMFNTMAQTLGDRHRELSEAKDRLDRLSRHLQIVRESEAKRIARELHDEIGQVLTSIKLDLYGFKAVCRHVDAMPCSDKITSVHEKLDGLVEFVRCIASSLRPPVLDQMGVVPAIQLLARKIEESSDLAVEVEATEIEAPKDWLTSITLYRIAQESLTNIIRHARATMAWIKLYQTETDIMLVVEDNGTGFDIDGFGKDSLGIIGMKERARLVGGTFEISSVPMEGTKVAVTIPLRHSETDEYKQEESHAHIAG